MPVPDSWLALNAAPGVGPARFHRWLRAFPNLDDLLGASASTLAGRLGGLDEAAAGKLLRELLGFDAAGERERMEAQGIWTLGLRDSAYPRRLLASPNPAPLLYVKGRLPQEGQATVAVVGTRQATPYGLAAASRLSRDLSLQGVAVVSGLARGIDGAAHTACLEAGGLTLACLGHGLGTVYPPQHQGLAGRIVAEGGALLSQFPLEAPPARMHFPMRNALIAGLSQGVLVVEGEEDSGSLITANHALDFGREVFAVPGPMDAPMSQGPLSLIAAGAKLVRCAADIVEELGMPAAPRPARARRDAAAPFSQPPQLGLPALVEDPRQQALVEALRGQPSLALDELGARAGLAPRDVSAAAVELEMLGALRQLPGGRYALANR